MRSLRGDGFRARLSQSTRARVADRAGKGGVGYSRRDATFVGETARELRFAVAKSSRRTRARLERSFAHAQTVLMETFVAVAEMRLGRAAAATDGAAASEILPLVLAEIAGRGGTGAADIGWFQIEGQ